MAAEPQHACICSALCVLHLCIGARLELFGSSANGFGSWHSDLDICMILGDQEEVSAEVGIEGRGEGGGEWSDWGEGRLRSKWRGDTC